MVKDIFAAAVPLQPEGHQAEDAALIILERQMTPGPALIRRGAARGLAGIEEVIADEGVARGGGQRFPRIPTDIGDRAVDAKGKAQTRSSPRKRGPRESLINCICQHMTEPDGQRTGFPLPRE